MNRFWLFAMRFSVFMFLSNSLVGGAHLDKCDVIYILYNSNNIYYIIFLFVIQGCRFGFRSGQDKVKK